MTNKTDKEILIEALMRIGCKNFKEVKESKHMFYLSGVKEALQIWGDTAGSVVYFFDEEGKYIP